MSDLASEREIIAYLIACLLPTKLLVLFIKRIHQQTRAIKQIEWPSALRVAIIQFSIFVHAHAPTCHIMVDVANRLKMMLKRQFTSGRQGLFAIVSR